MTSENGAIFTIYYVEELALKCGLPHNYFVIEILLYNLKLQIWFLLMPESPGAHLANTYQSSPQSFLKV